MKRDTKIVAAVLAAIPVAILSAATLCAGAIAGGASRRWRLLFLFLCHGIPSRCLSLWQVPMPICARCTGIYLGLLVGILAVLVLPKVGEVVARRMLFLSLFPIGVDGLTQAVGLRESTNPLRLSTGFLVGAAFACWVVNTIERSAANPEGREVTTS